MFHLPRIVQEGAIGILWKEATGEVVVGVHERPHTENANQEARCVECVLEHRVDHGRVVFRPEVEVLEVVTQSRL